MQGSPTRLQWIAAALLIGLYLGQGFWAFTRKSPVFDETGDIAAGLSYLQYHQVRANPQHPPLMKELAALPLWLSGQRLSLSTSTRRMLGGGGGERQAGSDFLAAGGIDGAMLLARAPMLLCSAGLGLAIFLWALRLAGPVAGLGALAAYVLDPNVMAHGYLATMDMGLATFATLFFALLWRYTETPRKTVLIAVGVSCGLMLCVKFSGLILLPVAAMLLWLSLGWRRAAASFAWILGIAAVVIQILYLSPGGLYLYRAGIETVNQDHNPDYLVYFAGQFAHSFPGYFTAAWLLKEPLPILLLFAAGIWTLHREQMPWTLRLFLLLPPIVVVIAHEILADDLGLRYILPALPFVHILCGVGAARMWQEKWGRPACAVLGLWLAVSSFAIYPDSLSYFNEAAGGWRSGPRWLDDSNVDWGQGMKQLREWLDAHAAGRPVALAYFGSLPPGVYLPGAQTVDPQQWLSGSVPGLLAASAHFVARTPALSALSPVAVVGHSIYIYEKR